jgi:FdhD protein
LTTGIEEISYLECRSNGSCQEAQGKIISEQAVSLTVNGKQWLTMVCSPDHLDDLGTGYLYNEGILKKREEISDIRVCPTMDNIDIWLTHKAETPAAWRRTSSCVGGSSSQQEIRVIPILNEEVRLPANKLNHLFREFLQQLEKHNQVGGFHASALCSEKEIILVIEDIGRHNTLDKIAGHCLLNNISPENKFLLTTGRISSEMVQKTAQMQIPVIISRTTPTSSAVAMAEHWGVTIVGYARSDRFTIFSHAHRIITNQADLAL